MYHMTFLMTIYIIFITAVSHKMWDTTVMKKNSFHVTMCHSVFIFAPEKKNLLGTSWDYTGHLCVHKA